MFNMWMLGAYTSEHDETCDTTTDIHNYIDLVVNLPSGSLANKCSNHRGLFISIERELQGSIL